MRIIDQQKVSIEAEKRSFQTEADVSHKMHLGAWRTVGGLIFHIPFTSEAAVSKCTSKELNNSMQHWALVERFGI